MPTYMAKIRKPTGETADQLVSVPSDSQLGEFLARIDGCVLAVTPFQARGADDSRRVTTASAQTDTRSRSRLSDLVLFTWHLHTLLQAGVPLVRALHVVQGEMEQAAWSKVLGRVIAQLEKGESFADSLRKFPRFFPDQFTHLIDVGEVSGNLDKVLHELATHGEKQLETRSQIGSALAYPLVLIGACGGVVLFLVSFVLPRIAGVFANMKMELPWITRTLLAIGEGMRSRLWLGVFIAGALAAGFVMLTRVPATRRWLDRALITLPGAGMLARKVILARFCRTLALLQRSGVSLLVSLSLARHGLRNMPLEEFFERVERQVSDGAPLGKELARSPYIPTMVSTMVTVGEESGQLSQMFGHVARFYERDVERTVRLLPKILEPLIIVVMTAVVGVIAASIFIPLARLPQGFIPH